MSLFDANPQTGIPDTAGYPVTIPFLATPTVPERPGPWVLPIRDNIAQEEQAGPLPLERGSVTYLPDPEDPERDQNSRLVAWYALTVFLVLMAFAAGWLVGNLKGGVQ